MDWIKVENRLPEAEFGGFSKRVLVAVRFCGKKFISIDRYDTEKCLWLDNGLAQGTEVYKWSYLPDVPEES